MHRRPWTAKRRGTLTATLALPLLLAGLSAAPPAAQAAACGDGIVQPGEGCDDGNTSAGDCCSPACQPAPVGSTCNDGRACTVEDACRRGVCVGTPVDGPCSTGLTPFACSRATRPTDPSLPTFDARAGEPVADELDPAGALDLRRAAVVCGSAAGTATGSPRLEGYVARPAGSVPTTEPMRVETAFGVTELGLGRPTRLLVESGLASGPDGAPPPTGVRRFVCRRATVVGRFAPQTLELPDAHGSLRTLRVGRPVTACMPETPSAAAGASPRAHGGYLVCHRAKVADRGAAGGLVSTANRFGSEVLAVGRVETVCLPGVAAEDPEPFPYPFFTAPGAVATAMRTLVEGAKAPRTRAAGSKALVDAAAAADVVRANLPAAQAALLTALQGLAPDDAGAHAALVPILEIAGDSPAILDHLHALAVAPPPGGVRAHDVSGDEMLRHTALAQLRYHAEHGSHAARQRVLTAVTAADPGIRALAVGHVYALGHDRRAAQRAMRPLLALEDHHLLYRE